MSHTTTGRSPATKARDREFAVVIKRLQSDDSKESRKTYGSSKMCKGK